MSADTCDNSVLFNEFHGFAKQVNTTIFNEAVPDAALDISSNCAVIDCPFYITCDVIYFRMCLCNPLYPAAPFPPVLFEYAEDAVIIVFIPFSSHT